MKKVFTAGLLILGTAAAFLSCKKGDSPQATVKPTGPYSSISDIFEQMAPKSRTVTIDASSGGTFYGNSGTRYVFQPNSFILPGGGAVTGNINIEVLEYLKESDMIFSGVLPVSNGEPLISGGEIYVKATQGSTELSLRPGSTFTANMPTNTGIASSGMSVFYGTVTGGPSGKVNWVGTSDSAHFSGIIYDGDTIKLISDSLEYVNADKFVKDPNYQTVNITLSGLSSSVSHTDVATFVLFDDYNGATAAGGTYSAGTLTAARIAGIKVHIAVAAIDGGEMYGGISSSIIPVTGSTYTISMSKTTPVAFKTALDLL